jgi:malate dehydrogenase (oxaloacetate-decarboxylating)(NADP+)
VAVPVLAIAEDPQLAYDYTNKGNLVAVVSNGTAILGSAISARWRPSRSWKARAPSSSASPTSTASTSWSTRPTRGGHQLRALSGAELRRHQPGGHQGSRLLHHRGEAQGAARHPVFHDDQHGTAIIAAAGLINALELTGPRHQEIQAGRQRRGRGQHRLHGAAGAMGMPKKNMLLCDTKGVIYRGRKEGMNQWKSGFAVETKARSLADALSAPMPSSACPPPAR